MTMATTPKLHLQPGAPMPRDRDGLG